MSGSGNEVKTCRTASELALAMEEDIYIIRDYAELMRDLHLRSNPFEDEPVQGLCRLAGEMKQAGDRMYEQIMACTGEKAGGKS